jgi:hypothetical protein
LLYFVLVILLLENFFNDLQLSFAGEDIPIFRILPPGVDTTFTMPSLLQTLLLLALVTFVLASPYPQPHIQKRSFKVERVPNPKFKRAVGHKRSVGAGTRALIKAYRKFGMPLPEALGAITANAGAGAGGAGGLAGDISQLLGGAAGGAGGGKGNAKATKTKTTSATKTKATSAAISTSTGTSGAGTGNSTGGVGVVVNTPEAGDVEYLSPVTIGGQTMNMDFDSGSSDLWVFNTQLATASQAGHTNFNPQKSTTFKMQTGSTFSISYGDGSGAAGNVGTDTVNIGGATVTSQAIELATAVSASFVQDTQSNGLVGLAYSKLNTVKPVQANTFFANAMPNMPLPVFTADLRAASSGTYEFGAIDSTKFNGSLTWAAVNTTNGFWQFSSQKFSVGTGTSMMSVAGGQAIADTGTTLMLVDPSVVNAYYSTVQGAVNNATVGGVTFPCKSVLPDLQVDVGGTYMATVRGDDINFAPVDQAGTSKSSSESAKREAVVNKC